MIWDKAAGTEFIDKGAWTDIDVGNPQASRGTIRSVLVAPGKRPAGGAKSGTASLAELGANVTSDWRVGEKAPPWLIRST